MGIDKGSIELYVAIQGDIEKKGNPLEKLKEKKNSSSKKLINRVSFLLLLLTSQQQHTHTQKKERKVLSLKKVVYEKHAKDYVIDIFHHPH